MKTYFVTPTEIDPKSWSMIGVSSKPNSDNPIGRFGTGLKYAIAISLRLGWDIKITNYANGVADKHVFSQAKDSFRGAEIHTIYDNKDRLPYTTHYGSHWEPWTVLRELYSNTLDEGGYMNFDDPAVLNGSVIEISSEEMYDLAKNCDEYFLRGSNFRNNIVKEYDHMQILSKSYAGKIFFKGVYIGDMPKCVYGYNLERNVKLTEDRTMADSWSIGYDITHTIVSNKYDPVINDWILSHGSGEELFSVTGSTAWHQSFVDAVKEAKVKHPSRVMTNLVNNLPKQKYEYEKVELKEVHEKMLSNALSLISKAGFPTHHKISYIKTDDDRLIAFVEDGTVHLTLKAFKNSDYLISTLIEEFAHCEGYSDETRSYETYLCDCIARLVSLI